VKRILLIALTVLVACKGRQNTAGPTETPVNTDAEKPSWVRGRPVSDMDYVGIGLCPKSRPDFQESAKKNALNDLVSEITVRVEGNSLLYTLDRKDSFDESFTSAIKTTANEQIQGHELVDTWQNETEYWVYYRLSKAEHARIKAERKAKALGQATDGFVRARESVAAGDLKGAFDQDLRALIAMKEYWGENDLVTLGAQQVSLANEIFSDLQKLTTSVRLSALPERCALDFANGFKREMLLSAQFASGNHTRDLAQLPLTIIYPANGGKVTENKNTDAEGRLHITVQRVDLELPTPEMLVRLDMDALVSKDLDPTFTKPVVGSLTVPELHVAIDRTMPRVFMQATETNLGQPVTDAGIGLMIREELTRRGFRFVDRAADADLLLNLNSSTREAGASTGFFTTMLDVSYTFKSRRTGEVVLEGGKAGVKGIQLDHVRAGMDAYKKAGQDLRKDLIPAMMNALL
jgi:hypothetical protein